VSQHGHALRVRVRRGAAGAEQAHGRAVLGRAAGERKEREKGGGGKEKEERKEKGKREEKKRERRKRRGKRK
jgi:hypothetical protein